MKQEKDIIGKVIITRTISGKLTNFNLQLENINPDEAIGLMTRMTGEIIEGLKKDAQRNADKGKSNQNYFG